MRSRRPIPLSPRPDPARDPRGASSSRPGRLAAALALEARETRGTFRASALAISAPGANAVGAVRLACEKDALAIELVRVFGFAAGFAPSAVAEPITLRVPYAAVRGLVRQGAVLRLALDPAAAKPWNRFALASFRADGAAPAPASEHATRARAKTFAWLAPLPIAVLAFELVPADLAGGPLGAASFATLVGAGAWLCLRSIATWLASGGPRSDVIRDAFEQELGRRLGLVAAPSAPSRGDELRAAATAARESEAFGAFARGAAAIAIAAAFVVLVLVGGRAALTPPTEPTRAVDVAERGVARAALGVAPPSVASEPLVERCLCDRADSPLWAEGVPAGTKLFFEGADAPAGPLAPRPPDPEHPKRKPRFDFDVALVNNAALAMHDVQMTFTFARRSKAGERVGVTDRGVYWAGPLLGGHAIRWHVKGPGTEVRVDSNVAGTLEALGVAPASPDAFAELARSRYRAVRVHAIAMLAYLRDPRAATELASLGEGAEIERPTLARIARASAPVIACDVRFDGARVEACVFNASTRPRGGLALRVVGAEASAPIGVEIPVHQGVRVAASLASDPASSPELEVIESLQPSEDVP